jgi:hypothetical protein
MPAVLFRILAVTLLSLTIPLQGMASVVAGQCMAFGHHDDATGHGHERANAAADAHGDEEKASHCGPCTACCASVSIAGPAGLAIQSSPSNTKYRFSQLAPPGAEPQRFDRPPLSI